jgi:hypothetical protein
MSSRHNLRFLWLLLTSLPALVLPGCKADTRQDTVLTSAVNPSHTYRATVVLRQYYVDGKFDTAPTTYVLVDPDTGRPEYGNGEDFKDAQVVMKPTQCGPLSLKWVDDSTLKIRCEKCGLALSALGEHASGVGAVRVEYEGFPEMSSWETMPRAN